MNQNVSGLPAGRDRMLDIFRGITVALMILVNNPGTWNHLYPPLAHAAWHGWTLTDLVFPFFLFAVGNSLALTSPVDPPRWDADFWRKWSRRSLLIFAIGLLLNAWPFVKWGDNGALQPRDFDTLRIMGVLQRIALCWAIAALIIRAAGLKGALWSSVVLLVGYWAVCLLFAASTDPYSLEGFFGTTLDRMLLGEAHLYRGEGVPFDPEGLASTPPAVAQVLLGYVAGAWILRHRRRTGLLRNLLLVGATLAIAGSLAHAVMPINKKIWTSSYVLLTTGLAVITIGLLIQLLENSKTSGTILEPVWQGCEAFGRNALLIFALSGLVPRTLALIRLDDSSSSAGAAETILFLPWVHREFFAPIAADPRLGSFLFAFATLLVYWAVAAWLNHKRWYFKA